MIPRRTIAAAFVLIVWSGLWFAPWRLWLLPWPWVRTVLALVLFLAPGVTLHAVIIRDAKARPSERIAYGFALSVMLTGCFGLASCVAHRGLTFVLIALWTTVAMGGLRLARSDWRVASAWDRTALTRTNVLQLIPLLVVMMLAARLAWAPAGGTDDFTYVARITAFQQADTFSFRSLGFGDAITIPPRYWLEYWTLSEAVIATLAGVHGLELTNNYLAPFLALLAFAGLFELARSLGFSRPRTAVVLTAQLASLIALTESSQAGKFFFNNLTEDKIVAAFVLAPICLAATTRYWAAPARCRLLLASLCYLALALTHPTSLAVTVLITFAYGGCELLATGQWRGVTRLLAVVAVVTAAASIPRFVDHPARAFVHFTVMEAKAAGEFGRSRMSRLVVDDDQRRFRVASSVVPKLAQAIGAAVLIAALVRVRRERAARYVVGALLVMALPLLQNTAWLLGLLITPFHLWRVPWQAPFGIGLALMIPPSAAALPRIMQRFRPLIAVACQIVALIIVLVTVLPHTRRRLFSFKIPRDWRSGLYTDRELLGSPRTCRRTYADLIAMGRLIDTLAPGGAVVVGDLPDTNNFLPSVSTKARLVLFRQAGGTVQHAGLTLEEARVREAALTRLFAADAPGTERLEILSAYRVEFVLYCGLWPEAGELTATHPPAVQLEATAGDFRLYRVRGTDGDGASH